MGLKSVSLNRIKGSPRARRLTKVSAAAVTVGILVTFAYSASVVEHFPGDTASSFWVQSWRAGWLDAITKAFSVAGLEVVAGALVALAAVALFLKNRRAEIGLLVAATAVGYGVRTALKVAVARPRPSADVVQVIQESDGYSFPSGHVMHYAVFFGTLAFILSMGVKRGVSRWLIQGAAVVIMLSMGFSRIYLGVHWVSDVVAGYAFGAVVVAGAMWTWQRWTDLRDNSNRQQ